MKNLFIIHSYDADTKETFGPYLVEKVLELGLNPIFCDFPILNEANYQKWADVMDYYLYDGSLNSESTIIAHSLGTLFIPKYLSERNIHIKLYISCAGFLNDMKEPEYQKIIDDFRPSEKQIDKAIDLIDYRYSIYSNDDHLNSQDKLEYYAKRFKAEKIFIPNIGHLGIDSGIRELPQAIEIIKINLSDKNKKPVSEISF
jgi:Predicted esterase of the alpha/beta hydrolase fold